MKSILFHMQDVQAVKDGRKNVVRLPVTKATNDWCLHLPETYFVKICHVNAFYPAGFAQLRHEHLSVLCNPPYRIGDSLWVKETFANTWTLLNVGNGYDSDVLGYIYKADGTPAPYPYWGNAKHGKSNIWQSATCMPQAAARLFLQVTDICIERLQDITTDQLKKEGIIDRNMPLGLLPDFIGLWESTNKNKEHQTWNNNPWVWVIEFEKIP